jgi:nucleotide-binding universal stress UspA family protein
MPIALPPEEKSLTVFPRDSPAIQLEALAKQEAADLIVAGAFGHGKLREWILGGVTRDLLGQSSRCQLMAH